MNIAQSDGVHDVHESLASIGVSESLLSAEEKASLDERGYVVFRNLMDADFHRELSDRYEEIINDAGVKDKDEEPGTRRPHDLINRGEVFDGPYTHPKVLAAVHYVIKRPFKLSNYCGRDALPG